MSYVYILRLNNGRYYTGSCRNLDKRLKQHECGYVKSTRGKLPLEIIYARLLPTYSQARKEEIRIKSWKKRRSIENLCRYDINNLINSGPIV